MNEGNVVLRLVDGLVIDARLIDFNNCEVELIADNQFIDKITYQWYCVWSDLTKDHKSFKKYKLDKEEINDLCNI